MIPCGSPVRPREVEADGEVEGDVGDVEVAGDVGDSFSLGLDGSAKELRKLWICRLPHIYIFIFDDVIGQGTENII